MKPVLYVDDEAQNLTVFEAAFEDEYDLSLATSGREALRILAERPIHVLVTDMRMPEMTGVQLLEASIPAHPDIVRIILTGYTDIDVIVQAINLGRIYQYITKPWNEAQVREVIDRALRHYESVHRQRELLSQLEQQDREEQAILSVFQRYVPRSVLDQVLARGIGAEIDDAEARVVTLLFADVRGFTTLCSRLDPKDVLELMNAYYDVMSGVVGAHGGHVHRFLGDGLLALFGAPETTPDHEYRAARAALAMVEALAEFNRGRIGDFAGEALTIGIGIHRGEVVAGNMGSPDKLEYSAVGPPLHQVAQIESRSKGHSNAILLSEAVRARIGDGFALEPFESLTLEGDRDPTALHRLLLAPPPGEAGAAELRP